ncbi:MAG: DMT family transporter [Candidatus Puniceispirillaceae bacterium]
MKSELKNSRYGLLLALFGALMITPDTLFMRLSEMPTWVMMAWRGLEMGCLLLLLWAGSHLLARNKQNAKKELAALFSPQGCGAVLCTLVGGSSFTYGIAESSVAIVLITIACAPVFAALFSLVFLSEWISRASWSAIFCCFIGIIIAVSDGDNVIAAPDGSALIGAICGLTAAASLGLSFVLLRSNDAIPLLGMNGLGSFLVGCVGLAIAVTTPDGPSLFAGNMLMISVSGLIILPISFVALTSATRHTNAANVSLFMFLETILGSFWVWLGVGERPGFWMMVGGAIVLSSLSVYILSSMRTRPATA